MRPFHRGGSFSDHYQYNMSSIGCQEVKTFFWSRYDRLVLYFPIIVIML